MYTLSTVNVSSFFPLKVNNHEFFNNWEFLDFLELHTCAQETIGKNLLIFL
jgi:hypothetical protein